MPDRLDPAILLIAALLPAPLTALAGWRRPAWAAPVAVATTLVAFATALLAWAIGGGERDVAWAPTWDLRLAFTLDALAVLYALLATGVGLAVVVYAARYLPLHLEHQHRPAADAPRFYAFILLFMGAMVGLVMAQDLLLLFLFWDLTAIASYFLIGYDRQEAASRFAALMAILVTGVSAVFLLIGAVILQAEYGTYSLPDLIARVESDNRLLVAGALMALAGLAKSAQVPLHFWLPRAMAAPTPVSAYLHSAAMVAAGVFLLQRLYPLLSRSERLLDGLLLVGFLSIASGGILALSRDELKPLLAYSTISQYGYVVVMLGLGGTYGAAGAAFYVLAHGLAKSALFLTAGAATEATGEKYLSRLGGLWRAQPLLAAGSGAAAATLAALPLTIGFFKDELFFAAALERGWGFAVLAAIGAALTVAYVGRFWVGIFLGPVRTAAHAIPTALVAPIVVLGLLCVAGGIVVRPAAELAEAAGEVMLGGSLSIHPAYHLDARDENLLALAAYGLGGLILVFQPLWRGGVAAVSRLGERVGPERVYRWSLLGLNRFSDRIHDIEVRDLRSRVATILFPAGVLVLAGFLATPTRGAFTTGGLRGADLPLILVLGLVALAAVATTLRRDHLSMTLLLSAVGYGLATVYALYAAPNVALVAVLIETLFSLLFLGFLATMPRDLLRQAVVRPVAREYRWRDPLLAVVSGLVTFLIVWGVLSKPAPQETVAQVYVELTPSAHAKNIVTAVLADFRGLDTMGEITVIGMVLLGVTTLLRTRAR
jgi:multicomponent Na+:H+ antiporter subunit A